MYLKRIFFLSTPANHFQKRPCRYVEVAQWEECKDINHFTQVFQDVIDKGGEGIILRDPSGTYKPGRSPSYLKHKVSSSILLAFSS